jgi:heat shock protein HtpX
MLTIAFSIWFDLTQNKAASPGLYASWWALLLIGGCVGLALTPIGEALFRLLYGCRRPIHREEEKLRPLFEEVCRAAQVAPDRYDLYVSDDKFPNAFAIGRRTVCLTRSLLTVSDDDTILGVIAHELGHHVHGDAVRSIIFYMITLVGQVIMWGGWLVAKILHLLTAVAGFGGDRQLKENAKIFSVFASLVWVLMWVFQIFVWVPIWIGAYFGSRQNEYRADKYAAEIGYSEGLLSFLNQIIDLDGQPSGFMGILYRTHPKTGDRIRSLEELEESGSLPVPFASRTPAEDARLQKIAAVACAITYFLALGWTAFAVHEASENPLISTHKTKLPAPKPPVPKKPAPKPPVPKKTAPQKPAPVEKLIAAAETPPAPKPKRKPVPAPAPELRPLPNKTELPVFLNIGIRTDRSKGTGYYEKFFDRLHGKGKFKEFLGRYYQNYKAGKEISGK